MHFYWATLLQVFQDDTVIHDSARFKYKLMGFMVYF
jgi:hypothetical protein